MEAQAQTTGDRNRFHDPAGLGNLSVEARSFVAGVLESAPANLPIGVRAALTMKTWPFGPVGMGVTRRIYTGPSSPQARRSAMRARPSAFGARPGVQTKCSSRCACATTLERPVSHLSQQDQ